MKVKITQGKYEDMLSCCKDSLFSRGKIIENTATSDRALDDYAYEDVFPISWKYVDGYEAPMAVYNFREIWLNTSKKEYFQLPSDSEDIFEDLVTHYPFTKKGDVFVVVSKQRKDDEWQTYLLVFKHNTNWQLAHRKEFNGYLRPIQFTPDDQHLILLRESKICLFSLSDFGETEIPTSDEHILTDAHLSNDKKSLLGILLEKSKYEELQYYVADVNFQASTILQKGINIIDSNLHSWLRNSTYSLAVDNGRVEISLEILEP